MIPGTNVKIGTKTYLIPPLNFAALRKHKAFIVRLSKGVSDPSLMGDDDFEVMFDLVYMAIKRNYPDLTEADLAECLDMPTVQAAMIALMKVSGFEEVEAKAGE